MHLHLRQAKVFISKENSLFHNHFIQGKYICGFVHKVVKHLNAMETLLQVSGKNLMTFFLQHYVYPHFLREHFTDSHIHTHTSCRTYGPSQRNIRRSEKKRERKRSLGAWQQHLSLDSAAPLPHGRERQIERTKIILNAFL